MAVARERIPGQGAPMQFVGLFLAVLGTTLIVLAALQFGASILGESQGLAASLGIAGVVLLVLGAWLSLRRSGGRRRA